MIKKIKNIIIILIIIIIGFYSTLLFLNNNKIQNKSYLIYKEYNIKHIEDYKNISYIKINKDNFYGEFNKILNKNIIIYGNNYNKETIIHEYIHYIYFNKLTKKEKFKSDIICEIKINKDFKSIYNNLKSLGYNQQTITYECPAYILSDLNKIKFIKYKADHGDVLYQEFYNLYFKNNKNIK